MCAMSSGLMSMARFGDAAPPSADACGSRNEGVIDELSIGTPSTMNNGSDGRSVPPPKVLIPRIVICVDAPGSPEVDVTCTPGALAASAVVMFGSLDFRIDESDTLPRAVASSRAVAVVPSPVTTISSSCNGLAASVKFCVVAPPARVRLTVCSL